MTTHVKHDLTNKQSNNSGEQRTFALASSGWLVVLFVFVFAFAFALLSHNTGFCFRF
jgi:hypothetical protein